MNNPHNFLRQMLAHPKLRGIDLDDPETTRIHKEIILSNSFLRQIYENWYSAILSTIPVGHGQILELGSGGGFLDQYIPAITSEFFFVPTLRPFWMVRLCRSKPDHYAR